MALDIWAGQQADRIDLDALLQAHDDHGLVIVGSCDGDTVKGDRGAGPEGLFSELLRLAFIGADAIRVLDDRPRALSHFSWVMADLQRRDAERVERLSTFEPAAAGRARP